MTLEIYGARERTSREKKLSRAHDIASSAHEMVSRAHEIIFFLAMSLRGYMSPQRDIASIVVAPGVTPTGGHRSFPNRGGWGKCR